MAPNTVLITGGSGYLGRHLCRLAEKEHTIHTTYFSRAYSTSAGNPHRLDTTNPAAVRHLLARLRPDAVIHCAAANPGSDETRMMAVNRDGAANIAASAAEFGARLVHISTDMVHDGRRAPYPPTAEPTPINPYGKSKAAAEAAVTTANPTAAIVRTSLIYGLDEMDRGTAGFALRLQAGEALTLFEDHIRQPVWVETLSAALLKLAGDRPDIRGVLNIAGRQALSRAEFGERLRDWWGVEHRERLSRGRAAELLPFPTPLDLRLEISAAEAQLGIAFPGVDDVLAICKTRRNLIK